MIDAKTSMGNNLLKSNLLNTVQTKKCADLHGKDEKTAQEMLGDYKMSEMVSHLIAMGVTCNKYGVTCGDTPCFLDLKAYMC